MNEPNDMAQERIEVLQDELRWDSLFKKTQPQLITAARRAKQQIAEGKASSIVNSQHGVQPHERI